MFHAPKWSYMLHGNLFLRYTSQDYSNKGSRGDDQFDAPNWLMFMGQKPVGKNRLFHFSTMFSFDPITEGGGGYPLDMDLTSHCSIHGVEGSLPSGVSIKQKETTVRMLS